MFTVESKTSDEIHKLLKGYSHTLLDHHRTKHPSDESAARAMNLGQTLRYIVVYEETSLSQFPGSIKLGVEEGPDNLWAKTKKAYQYVCENHPNDADWFLKADADSFVIMENLACNIASILNQYANIFWPQRINVMFY